MFTTRFSRLYRNADKVRKHAESHVEKRPAVRGWKRSLVVKPRKATVSQRREGRAIAYLEIQELIEKRGNHYEPTPNGMHFIEKDEVWLYGFFGRQITRTLLRFARPMKAEAKS